MAFNLDPEVVAKWRSEKAMRHRRELEALSMTDVQLADALEVNHKNISTLDLKEQSVIVYEGHLYHVLIPEMIRRLRDKS